MLREELENKATEAVTMVYGKEVNPNLVQQLKNMYLLGIMEGVDVITSRVMEIEDPDEALSFLEEVQEALNNIRLDMMEKEVTKYSIIPEVNYREGK